MSFLRLMALAVLAATIALSRQIALAQAEPQSAASITVTPSLANAAAGAMPAGPGAVPSAPFSNVVVGSSDSIPDGTIITMQNWQNYRQFMPEGMASFFEGRYFWKMPADVCGSPRITAFRLLTGTPIPSAITIDPMESLGILRPPGRARTEKCSSVPTRV